MNCNCYNKGTCNACLYYKSVIDIIHSIDFINIVDPATFVRNKTNSVFDKLYDIFPCLVINEWNDITEELLNSNLTSLKLKINDFFEKYPDCYFNINVLDDLLLTT